MRSMNRQQIGQRIVCNAAYFDWMKALKEGSRRNVSAADDQTDIAPFLADMLDFIKQWRPLGRYSYRSF